MRLVLVGMLLFSVAELVFVVLAPLQLSFLVRRSCSITIWRNFVWCASSQLCSWYIFLFFLVLRLKSIIFITDKTI